jgi:hypothetical protein
MGLMALIAVEPGHRHSLRESPWLRFSMTVKTLLPVRDKGLLLPRRKRVTTKARDILHTHPVYLEPLVTIQTIGIIGAKGVTVTAVTVPAGEFFPRDMPGVARRCVHADRTLRGRVPVTLHTEFPGRLDTMGLGAPVRREHELHEQPVLFQHREVMAVLAHDGVVAAQLPVAMSIFHQVAAAAELGAVLDVVVVTDAEDDAQDGNDEQNGDQDRFVPGAQAPVKPVEYFGEKGVHG